MASLNKHIAMAMKSYGAPVPMIQAVFQQAMRTWLEERDRENGHAAVYGDAEQAMRDGFREARAQHAYAKAREEKERGAIAGNNAVVPHEHQEFSGRRLK